MCYQYYLHYFQKLATVNIVNLTMTMVARIRCWAMTYCFLSLFIITPCRRAVIFYYCINNVITLILLADIQFSRFITEPTFYCNIPACKLSINLVYISLQNHQYSNHTPKFSLNIRVWPTKLLIIWKCRCGCQRSMQVGDGKLLYYKWWPYMLLFEGSANYPKSGRDRYKIPQVGTSHPDIWNGDVGK